MDQVEGNCKAGGARNWYQDISHVWWTAVTGWLCSVEKSKSLELSLGVVTASL